MTCLPGSAFVVASTHVIVIDDNPLAHSSYPIDATFEACNPLTDNRLTCEAITWPRLVRVLDRAARRRRDPLARRCEFVPKRPERRTLMEIGKPERKIRIVPVEEPVPTPLPMPEPADVPVGEPAAEPASAPA